MIATDLPIAEIALRLGGEVVSPNMARAPACGAGKSDRSLVIIKSGGGLVVVPRMEGDDLKARPARMAEAKAYVQQKIKKCDMRDYTNKRSAKCATARLK